MPDNSYPALQIFDVRRGKWEAVRKIPAGEEIEMATQSDEGTFWRTPDGELYRGDDARRGPEDWLMRVIWIGRVR